MTNETYREGADGGGRELGQVELLLLDLLADSEGALAVEHVRSDSSDALPDGIIGGALELATLANGSLVRLVGSSDLGVLGAREDRGNDSDLLGFLQGEREPVLLFSSEPVLGGKRDGSVEERRRGGSDHTVSANDIDGLLAELDGSVNVGLPDVTAGHETEGNDQLSGLDGGKHLVELSGNTSDVDVDTSDGELGDDRDVGVKTAVVGGKDDLGGDGSKLGVSGDEFLLVVARGVEDEDRLVNLNPFSASCLEVGEELLVHGKQLGEEGDGLESSLRFLGGLSENEEGDRAEDNRAGGDTDRLCLLEFLNCLVEKQLELGLLRELGDDEVVVGVKPEI